MMNLIRELRECQDVADSIIVAYNKRITHLEAENESLRESMLSIAISANMEGSETLVRANLLRICMIANSHLRKEQE